MKIYILQWLNSNADFVACRQAFSNKAEARKEYRKLKKEAETEMDLTLGEFEDNCKQYEVKKKSDLINLINSLT